MATSPVGGKKANDGRVPVTVLTGFLGAGKTTLLNHILTGDHGLRFAIIENEFGEVGVDEKILGNNSKDLKSKIDEEIIEVMNGCICCTVRGDLVEALKNLYTKVKKFDGIIIETTGLADPAPVAQTFFIDDKVADKYVLDGIVTVVDAKHIHSQLDDEKPEGVENESVEQLAFADKVILNKIDLVPEEKDLVKIEDRIREINTQAEIIRATNSVVDWKEIINCRAFDIKRILDFEPDFLEDGEHEHLHDDRVSSCSVKFEGELNVFQLEQWVGKIITEKGADLFRYKGVLAVKGMEEKYIFQGVQMLFKGGFSDGIEWGKDEPRECRFVFIGRNLNKEELIGGVKACQVTKELRFKVGDKVEANVGKFTKGEIIKVWDDGNPYRIRLDKSGGDVWGPMDDDAFVRVCGA